MSSTVPHIYEEDERLCHTMAMPDNEPTPPEPASEGVRGEALNPVSRKLVPARYISVLPFTGAVAIAGIVLALIFHPAWWVLAGAGAAMTAFALWIVPVQVKRIGWLETENELLISKGRLWHQFTVVPYGRIQYVDVTAGPIAQAFGIQTVTLNTASSTSDSSVPGLPANEATALRRRLADKARERMSGL